MSALRLGGESKGPLLVLAVSIAVIIAAFVLRPNESDEGSRIRDTGPDAGVSASESPTAGAKPKSRRAAKDGEDATTQNGFAVPVPSLPLPPGLLGDGASMSAPKHKLTIKWSSPNPLGLIAYVIPTSEDKPKGSWVERSRRELTLTTTVYGRPDYAVAYVQAGGAPATCEIYVDGRRTARRTTEGPYGAVWCQG